MTTERYIYDGEPQRSAPVRSWWKKKRIRLSNWWRRKKYNVRFLKYLFHDLKWEAWWRRLWGLPRFIPMQEDGMLSINIVDTHRDPRGPGEAYFFYGPVVDSLGDYSANSDIAWRVANEACVRLNACHDRGELPVPDKNRGLILEYLIRKLRPERVMT